MSLNNEQDALLNQLFTQVVAGHLNTQSRIRVNNEENRMERCPGLNRLVNSNYVWTIPEGMTSSERTYCPLCTEKYNIEGQKIRLTTSDCNCDIHRLLNKADNGIFNISFWESDLYNMISTTKDSIVDNIYYVNIPSGTKFSILLQSCIQKKQAFKYEVEFINSGCEKSYNLYEESDIFVVDSCFVGSKRHIYGYVDSDNPGWDVLNGDDRVSRFKIIKPGDTMIIKLHIYNIVEHDFDKDSGRDLGLFKLNTASDGTKTISNASRLSPKQQSVYDSKPYRSQPQYDFVKYTVKPMELKFIFATAQEGTNDCSSELLQLALDKMISFTNKKINFMKKEMNTFISNKDNLSKKIKILGDEIEIMSNTIQKIEEQKNANDI